VPRRLRAASGYANGTALIPLTCRLGENCVGTLRLQNLRPKGAVVAGSPATYGTATFTIASGKQVSIKVRRSSAGQALMKKYRSRQVWANATLTIHSTRVVVSMRITLRR
jgi:hypothetical protein